METKLKAVTVRLSPELWKQVKMICAVLDIPIYQFIMDAIKKKLAENGYRGE